MIQSSANLFGGWFDRRWFAHLQRRRVRAASSTALAPTHRLLMSVVYGNESAAEIISPEGLADSPSDAAKPLQLTHATPIQGYAAAEEKCPTRRFGVRKPRDSSVFEGVSKLEKVENDFFRGQSEPADPRWRGFGSFARR